MNKHTPSSNLPVAKKVSFVHEQHGHQRKDNYHWLRDDSRSNQLVIDHLHLENSYTDEQLAETKPLIKDLYDEMTSRLPKRDQSVPAKIDNYWYYSRYSKNKEYPIYARKLSSLENEEQVMLDMNEYAQGHSYFNSNYQAISPNHDLIGFSQDTTGRRQYSLHFKNLKTGEILKDQIENTTGSVVWAKDNKTVFYIKKHPKTLLPYQVFRHKLGSSEEDVLVYEEKDHRFYTAIASSTSKNYIFIYTGSTNSTEVLVLNANSPETEFRSFLPREEGHEYSIDELQDTFYVLSNWKAKNFRVMKTKLSESQDKSLWNEVVAHSDETLIYDIHAFQHHLAVEQRTDGVKHIKILDLLSHQWLSIPAQDSSYTMEIDFNPDSSSSKLKYSYTSLREPSSVLEYDVESGESVLLKQDEVVGDYNSKEYHTQRIFVSARDGEEIPVSLIYKKSEKDLNHRPLLIYAYGSYGSSVDPRFSYARVSLLDRGWVFAIAHVRGSQAKGRRWYEQGRMLNKKNTFYDFIDATKGLSKKGIGDSKQVFAMGGSAGGLLIGAVANMEPGLYKGMVAQVPFVDVVTTMLDEDIPLTTGEFEEWGNPKEKKYYDYMLSYSPYDQVKAQHYPHLYVSTGLHDSQVQYWEPAKWVAKLRELKTDNNLLLFRVNMDAGHGGASGRYQIYKEIAEEYGFLLMLVNS